MTFLNPIMKVGDQITEAIMLHQKVGPRTASRMAIRTLELVGMASPERIVQTYPNELSGGMRQRVIIAIAISCEPLLMILDEPTTALDVTVQAQILDLIVSIKNQLKTSQLLITHDLGIVAELCDEVYVMYAGKIAEHADIFEIFDNPLHPYTKGLLESVLSIDGFRKELVSIEGNVPSLIDPPRGCRFASRCKFAMKICEEDPPLIRVSKTHEVSCWLYDDGGKSDESH